MPPSQLNFLSLNFEHSIFDACPMGGGETGSRYVVSYQVWSVQRYVHVPRYVQSVQRYAHVPRYVQSVQSHVQVPRSVQRYMHVPRDMYQNRLNIPKQTEHT